MQQVNWTDLQKILQQSRFSPEIEKKVRMIIDRVKEKGDEALFACTELFDGARIRKLRVSEKEIRASRRYFKGEIKTALQQARLRIEVYHRNQIPSKFVQKEKDCRIEFCWAPLDVVGIYVPSSQAPLVSSVLMTVVPAKVAGCQRIVVCTPPGRDGKVNPYLLSCLDWLGIKDIFKVGGAQAVAAMALGTESIPQVDKVVGPGSVYVNTAKKLLFGETGVDTLAGPSELVIFSDESGVPAVIAADLAAQMEHVGGTGILLTTCESLGRKVELLVRDGYWLLVKNEEQALNIINQLAPEHLQILCWNPSVFIPRAVAGVIFVGEATPTVIGDYFAGPSHVLPTQQAARHSSGVSVYTFLRSYAVIRASKDFLKKWGNTVKKMALLEGLTAHARSIEIRLTSGGKKWEERQKYTGKQKKQR